MRESELCEKFIEAAQEDGWKVYPEVSGWDVVLVWEGNPLPAYDLQPGDQLAVEAKTRANVKSIHQAYTRSRGPAGPNFRTILVPKVSDEFVFVAAQLKLGVFTLEHCEPWTRGRSNYEYPRKTIRPPKWRFDPTKRLWLPPVVPDCQAGVASPQPLTKWRVGALKLCKILRERGWVTSKDFDALGLSMTIWKKKWLKHEGRVGRLYKYVGRYEAKDFPDKGWEAERDAIELEEGERYDYEA